MSYLDKHRKRMNMYGGTPQEKYLIEKKEAFNIYMQNAPNRYKLYFNNEKEGYYATLQDVSTKNKVAGDEKYVVTYNNTPIEVGKTFEWFNKTWLVIDKEHNTIKDHQTFKARPCNIEINFLNKNRKQCSTWAVVENAMKYTNGIYENKDLKIGDSRMQVTMPFNEDTKDFKVGERILLSKNHAYEITFIDVSSPKGLRIMILSQTPIYHEVDNLDLMIADYKGKAHDYKMEILNKSAILNKDDTCQLRIKVYDNKELIENSNIQYNVVDENIATVDDKGLIKGISEGETSVIVTFKNVQEEIKVQVIKDNVDNYTCEIIGSDKIAINRKKEYIAKFYKNGVEIEDTPLWKITNESNDKTNYAKCISVEGNKCIIQATSKWIFGDGKSKYIYIHLKGTTGKETIKKVKITSY